MANELGQLAVVKAIRSPDIYGIPYEHSLVISTKTEVGVLRKRARYDISIVEKKEEDFLPLENQQILFELEKCNEEKFNGKEFFVVRHHTNIKIQRLDYEMVKLNIDDRKGMIVLSGDKIVTRAPDREFTFQDSSMEYPYNDIEIINNRLISFNAGVSSKCFQIQEPFDSFYVKYFYWFDPDMTARNFQTEEMRESKLMYENHMNIAKIIDVAETRDKTIVVFESMDRDLYEEMKIRRFTEEEARSAIKQILNGVRRLHELEIDLNDIKLDNILVKKLNDNDYVFKVIGDLNRFFNFYTSVYAAPEVLNDGDVSTSTDLKKADMFSCGILFHALLTGVMPFKTTDEIIDENHIKANFTPGEAFKKLISDPAQRFVKSLLKSQDLRPSAVEALENPWFKGHPINAQEDSNLNHANTRIFAQTKRRSARIAEQRAHQIKEKEKIPILSRRNTLCAMMTKVGKRRSRRSFLKRGQKSLP